jgi:hypothetical protein
MQVTRASRCAQIGYHYIYKVDDTQIIYIPRSTQAQPANATDEQRYMKMLMAIDMTMHFYFSYTCVNHICVVI